MKLKDLDIESRTNGMYSTLNNVDKFNKNLDTSKVANCAEFINELLSNLIDGIEWEIGCLKKSCKFRGDSLELTYEISLLLDNSKIGYLQDDLKNNSKTTYIAKKINKLNSRYSYYCELGELVDEFDGDLNLALDFFNKN